LSPAWPTSRAEIRKADARRAIASNVERPRFSIQRKVCAPSPEGVYAGISSTTNRSGDGTKASSG
jgi:hypothetical protein